MNEKIMIREMTEADPSVISQAFADQGWTNPASQYLRYLQEGRVGKRTNLVAEYKGEFAGYVTVVWNSEYPPFLEAGIPEIVDFNVLIKFRRLGIGTALMDEAERRISLQTPVAGLGVCLHSDYGAAQVLYTKRGYVPDGRGVYSKGRYLKYGDQVIVDDDLTIYLTKQVQK